MSQKKRFSLTYNEKIHLQKDFIMALRNGRRLENQIIKIIAYKNPSSKKRRIGLITSRKVAPAVKRNSVKRKLREIFRTNKHSLTDGLDLIFISKSNTPKAQYEELKSAVLSLLEKAGLYR